MHRLDRDVMSSHILKSCLIVLILSCLSAMAQAGPSNAQLASPEIEKRVNDLLQQMTLEEKLGQLVQYSDDGYAVSTADESDKKVGANPQAQARVDSLQLAAQGKLGSMLNTVGAARTRKFQQAAVEKSRLRIPLLFGADIIHGYRTVYPVSIGMAATWDPDLVRRLCRMSAEEAVTGGIRWFYSPMVDISRDPRWGRTLEGAGEDPYLGATMAAAYVAGYQNGDLSRPDSVAASVKHFAAYGAAEAGRDYNTTDMSLSRLHQVYLPPYKAAVEAGAATIMSAFNALNGVPASANRYLLQDVLRDRWGFNGFVVSDYTAIMELTHHGVALDPASAAQKALTAGVDVDMMSHYYDAELPALVRSGKISISVVDEAVRRVLRVKFALGLFENPYPQAPEVTAAVPAHRSLARQAAEESLVLLQNNEVGGVPVLPLSPKTKTIALVGPLADDANAIKQGWSGAERNRDVVTLKDALDARAKQAGNSVLYAKGTEILGTSNAGFAEAKSVAGRADVVLIALGESGEMSGEGGSRAYLNLPGNQQQLLEEIVSTGKLVVLLIFSGRPLEISWAAQHVPGIVEAWFPGIEAGNAIANVLFGDVSPSGKLPMSFPRAVGQEPLYYNTFPTGRPPENIDLTKWPDGNTRFVSRYMDVPNDALFSFGHGLTYSRFSYSSLSLSRNRIPLSEAKAPKLMTASVKITNTGNRTATEVVQCYVGIRGVNLAQPNRNLKGFKRVTLRAGESQIVSFDLGFPELSFFNNDGEQIITAMRGNVFVGGSSLADQGAAFEITP